MALVNNNLLNATTPGDLINSKLFTLGGTEISISSIIAFVLIVVISYLIARIISRSLVERILRPRVVDEGIIFLVKKLVLWVILIIGFVSGLRVVGIELTSLVVALGVGGIAIGFGLQKIISNLISGLILMMERPLKIGDRIKIMEEWGDVVHIGIRSTTIKTPDNVEIIVPNEHLITEKVTNFTHSQRWIRLRIPIGVSYNSDIKKVEEVLLEIAEDNPNILRNPKPKALLMEFGDSSINFELRCYIVDAQDRPNVVDQVNKAIDQRFREEGIEIPFPQRTVHMRK